MVNLIFPHQLFRTFPLPKEHPCYLVEEHLFFNQYHFHKQKIAFHRASMKAYQQFLSGNGCQVIYIESSSENSDVRTLVKELADKGMREIHYVDTVDDWLNRRIEESCHRFGIQCRQYSSPQFLNTEEELKSYFAGKKRFFQTEFYIDQRKRRDVLMENGQPVGGKWTFDTDNRLKYPRNKIPPLVSFQRQSDFSAEATGYTSALFSRNYGELNNGVLFPIDHDEADKWLDDFLQHRLAEFGPYEDAIVAKESILHHSVLTPMLNVGLLTPDQIIRRTLDHAQANDVPLNSLEGFIRQIMGWREFIRAVYVLKGREERTKNFWGFKRKIPASFWTGTTGIDPVDQTIRKVLQTGYCHHIERLMVLGNFMLLCEFDPDEVYRWFMELFIDSYDWVMVPNVYGMSQFADGGIMSTKPYISGSNYILKMSDYKKDSWSVIWDALFWRFLVKHGDYFKRNVRMNMLLKTFDKKPEADKKVVIEKAESYLSSLW